jgi:mxaJ protein
MTRLLKLPCCVLLLAGSALPAVVDAGRELRVCADSDNLPFSNARLEGFENKIVQVIADDLHASVQYVWSPESSASIGEALNTGKCDMIAGAPAEWGPVLTTKPYYASTYVFVYSKKKYPRLSSFDDPVLRKLKIGLPVISGGGANPPPTYALARRGLSGNVIGFSMFQPDKIVAAVASGDIDAAVMWGPFGGYFAKRQSAALAATPVSAGDNDASLRFTYDISIGVRKGDTALKDQLEGVLNRRHKQIVRVLEDYGVPVISRPGGGSISANFAKSIQ